VKYKIKGTEVRNVGFTAEVEADSAIQAYDKAGEGSFHNTEYGQSTVVNVIIGEVLLPETPLPGQGS